jgi:hypothetical protein
MKKSPSLINRETGAKCLQIFLALEFLCRFIAEANSNVPLQNPPEKVQCLKTSVMCQEAALNFGR